MPPIHFHLLRAASALTFLSAPIAAIQALHLRHTILRLPEAAGPRSGLITTPESEGAPFRLLVFGESTAAGVGAATQNGALGMLTAQALAEQTKRPIAWRVIGKIGVTARVATEQLLPQLQDEQFDLVVIALGANDVMHLHSAEKWQRDLLTLLLGLRYKLGSAPIFISSIPPFSRLPILRQPLRSILAGRSRLYNEATRLAISPLASTWLIENTTQFDDSAFSPDRFHPGPIVYKQWADRLAEAWVQLHPGI